MLQYAFTICVLWLVLSIFVADISIKSSWTSVMVKTFTRTPYGPVVQTSTRSFVVQILKIKRKREILEMYSSLYLYVYFFSFYIRQCLS